ncbi:MAG: hypothetical protein SFU98_01435 [Leptospiraceae bacterium]|nr:hypothetical protein [Leptospiraceae bacterium]
MKFYLLYCIFFLSYLSPIFSETILLHDGTKIKGKILNQNINEIQLESEDGERRTISKTKLSRILFKDGLVLKSRKMPMEPESIPIAPEKPKEKIEISKPVEIEPTPEKMQMIFEVTKDNKVYLIDILGSNFNEKTFVTLKQSGIESAPQKIRNLSPTQFELCIDPEFLNTGEYDLVINSNGESEIRQRFIEIVSKETKTVEETKMESSSVLDAAQK